MRHSASYAELRLKTLIERSGKDRDSRASSALAEVFHAIFCRAQANAAVLDGLEEEKWSRLLASDMSALGYWLKSRSGVSNRWLSDSLKMGNISTTSSQISRYGRERSKRCPMKKALKAMQ